MKITREFNDHHGYVLNMARDMWAESTYREQADFCDSKCIDIGQMLGTETGRSMFALFLAWSDAGMPIGFVIGYISPHFFSTTYYAQDMALYVRPDWRGTSAAYRLLNAFKEWAVDSGAAVIRLGITTGVKEQATGRLYERMGFSRAGTIYELEV